MDLIYDDESKDLSLQSLTKTIIIQKILEDEGMMPNCKRDRTAIASKAIAVVNNLPLPLLLKWQLRRMVLPIMEEMHSWYHAKDKATRVVLTQNGTVDLQKSIRDMLNDENVSLMQRFKVACYHCLEQDIFDIGARINFPHNFCRPAEPDPRTGPYWIISANLWTLDEIWYKIYQSNFNAKLGLKDISEDYCSQGFARAFYTFNSAGVKYFLEKASPSVICHHFLFRIHRILDKISFTPDVCIKMFKRLNEDMRQHLKSVFSAYLLKAHLKWPYQRQFLKAAESLAKNIDYWNFLSVAARIAKKARYGWEDHDYKGLFINFWKLSREPEACYIHPVYYAEKLLYNVILMRDERLAHFLLDNTNKYFKTILFNCDNSSVCLRLISEKHIKALKLFIKVLRVNNDKLIVRFQKDIQEFSNGYNPIHRVYCPIIGGLKSEERKNFLLEFLLRMDKLKPQMSEISF